MDMKPVSSSNIHAVGYDAALKQMQIRFKDGGTYRYSGVLPEDHMALVTAESVGKHFHAHIKGKFPHRPI